MRHLLVALLGLVLAGCISPNQGRPLHFDEFPSAEYQALPVHGNGRIDGRAFLRTRAGTLKPAAGKDVALIPATRYMAPLYKAYQERRPLGEPDARAKIYTRTVRADAEGRFSFGQVPAGRYYLSCEVTWETSGANGPTTVGATVMAPLTLREGEEVQVELTR